MVNILTGTAFDAPKRLNHREDEVSLEFPSSAGSRRRGLLALKACNWRAASGGGWTNPYITDGLAQQYDGIWNAGGGIHADASTIWKDLVGTNDATLTQYATIAPDCLQIHGRSGYAASYRGDITDEYTIEAVVLCQIPVDNAPRITAESPYPSLYFASRQLAETWVAFYGQSLDTILSRNSLIDRTIRRTYAVTFSDSLVTGYVDGAFYGSLPTVSKPSSVVTATFGNRLSGNRGFNGEYCAFRRYSRALTPDEIAANYAVDKARFGLA